MMKIFMGMLLLLGFSTFAQQSIQSLPAWLVAPSLAYQSPGGDMEYRFGPNMSIGLGIGYKTADNWIIMVDGNYIFGNNVRNVPQLLAPILSDNGNIFNQTGNYADIAISERGIYGSVDISKTFNFLSVNPNSGPSLLFGAGYLSHWVHIDNAGNDSPQLMDEYDKGYDELSGGFMLKQSLGYVYLSQNRRINFRLSFEIMEGFTTNYRGFSYSSGKEVNDRMLDLMYGIRFRWMLPIYGVDQDTYFYD